MQQRQQMNGSNSNIRHHHYFLFRHCVRSTGTRLKLHLLSDDEDKDGNNDSENNISNSYGPFQSIPLDVIFGDQIPNWNTPPNACTAQGLEMVQATGKWLLQNIIEGRNIKVEILSDTTDRDIDTAYRLSLGMQDAVEEITKKSEGSSNSPPSTIMTVVEGLNQISYLRDMFEDPFPTQICRRKDYTDADMLAAIQHRLDTIPPPFPIPTGLERMKELLGGFGSNADEIWNRLDTTDQAATLIHQDHSEIITRFDHAGVVQILKIFGQFLFYSRAGGVHPVYLPHSSNNNDVYHFLAFVHWTRSILSVGNPQVAACGAVQAQIMIGALQYGTMVSTAWKRSQHTINQQQEYDTHVTILVGHDGDLDSMSTALGVRWDLPSPFISSSPNNASGDYQPTPPLSALHLVRSFSNDQEESIDISFLYPQYSNGTSWSNDDATGASRGILQSTNVIWRDGFQTDEVSMSTEATPFGTIARLLFSKEGSSARSKNDRGLLRNLEIHVETTLQHYPVSCLLLGFFFGCINARRPCLHRQRCNNMRGGTLVPPSDDNDEASQAHPKWDNKSTVSSSVTETLPNDLELL